MEEFLREISIAAPTMGPEEIDEITDWRGDILDDIV